MVDIVLITWTINNYRLNLLKRTMESLCKFTHYPHRLIVIDNGDEKQTFWLKQQKIDVHIINETNIGVGASRNLGSKQGDSEYIVFIDNDILLFEGWLEKCVKCLQKYSDKKLIAVPRKSSPMKLKKHHVGDIDDYQLYNRASGMLVCMRRKDFNEIGLWSEGNKPGGDYCYSARKKGYLYIWHPSWLARHLGKKSSYNYRKKLVNGNWI